MLDPGIGRVAILLAVVSASLLGPGPTGRRAAGQRCISSPPGLVSWWPGDMSADDVAHGNSGTLEKGARFVVIGKVLSAFRFDGVDDYVSIGNPASLKLTGSITLEAWVSTADLAQGQEAAIITKWGQSWVTDSYGLWLKKSSGVIGAFGAIGVRGRGDNGFLGGVIKPGVFHHVAMTYDSTTGKNVLYVDGGQVASRSWPGGIVTSDLPVMIGREATSNCTWCPRYFSGVIDEVALYDRALTPGEINAIFSAGAAGKCKLSGSRPARLGRTTRLTLSALGDGGLPLQMGSSLGTGPIPIGNRQLGLSPDSLLVASVNSYWPSIFSGFQGQIDKRGQAKAAINIPSDNRLIGQRLHTAFVTVSPGAPFGIKSISNAFSFSITK